MHPHANGLLANPNGSSTCATPQSVPSHRAVPSSGLGLASSLGPMRKILILGIIITAATSCAANNGSHATFAPLERAEGRTLEGYAEAIYDLQAVSGRFGEAKVWSRGAYIAENTGATLLHVGFDLENSGATPITLDPASVRLESVQTANEVLRDIPVSEPATSVTVAADSAGRAELIFSLPAGFSPVDILAFRVAWSVRANGEVFSEFTPFARTTPATYYVPVNAYYHPYYPYYLPYYDPLWGPRRRVVIVKRYPRRVVVRGRPHRSPPRRR